MAMTKSYYTVNGRIRGEASSGVRTEYLPDALGSVTATVDESGALINQYRYKPFGSRLSKTGAGDDPKFQWIGEWGYRVTTEEIPLVYLRARHYRPASGNWTTVDRLWPATRPYRYVGNRPTNYIDYTGLKAVRPQRVGPSPFYEWPVYGYPSDQWFTYGHYCGGENYDRRDSCDRALPIDCIDAACQQHDDCLDKAYSWGGNYWTSTSALCHCALAEAAKMCRQFGCGPITNYDSFTCIHAATSVGALFGKICGLTNATGLGIGIIEIGGTIIDEVEETIEEIGDSAEDWLPTRDEWWDNLR